MERSHLFIAGIVLVLLAAIVIVAGAIRLASSRPSEKPSGSEPTYTTFSNPTNIFESLSRDPEAPLNTSDSLGAETPERLQALQNIIQTWETRAGSSDARNARAALAIVEQKTPEQIEKEEITTLFNDLIGTKITDKLAQPSGSGVNGGDTIWLGGYSDAQVGTQTETSSAVQAALHKYGNDLGALLKSFGLAQGDQADTLDKFIKNRTNTTGLKKLTDDYLQLSSDINGLSAPAQLTSVHSGLVSSYASVGELLWNLSSANDDTELLDLMLTYNKSSEEVAKHHVTLVTLLKAHGVTFKSHEPGNIFTFSPPTRN